MGNKDKSKYTAPQRGSDGERKRSPSAFVSEFSDDVSIGQANAILTLDSECRHGLDSLIAAASGHVTLVIYIGF
jgi:hypothetical protein